MKNAKKNSFFEFSRARGVKMAAMYMSIRKGYWDCQSSLYPTPNGPFFVLVMIKLVIKLREVQFGL